MKLKIGTKKSSNLRVPTHVAKHARKDDDAETLIKKGGPSWLMVDPSEKKQAAATAKTLGGGERAPEIWFKDGDEKKVRFRDEAEVGALWRYTVEVDGNWRSFTMPEDGEVDLFRDELGLKPSLRYLYEVIDIDGFKDKKGKRQTNVARFWLVPQKVHDQLEIIRRKRGPLNQFDIEITCAGEKVNKGYQFFADTASPMTREAKAAPRLRADASKYYAPLPESEQRMVVKRAHVRSPGE